MRPPHVLHQQPEPPCGSSPQGAAPAGGELLLQLASTRAAPLLERSLHLAGPQAQQAGVLLAEPVVEHGLCLQADERHLLQVMNKLVSNAIKHNRRGGEVQLRAIRQGARACLTVRDTGLGLDEAQRRALFQPFNRLGAETASSGAGLGLVNTQQLVQRMGGSIQVESKLGAGSAFQVWLPLASNDPRHPEPAQALRSEALAALAQRPSAQPATAGQLANALWVEDRPVNVLPMEAVAARRPPLQLRAVGTAAEA